jgi:beta-glucosidase
LKKYYTDYNSYTEEQAAAQELNEEIAAESMILLKNKDESLPLDQGSKISVFGTRSVNLQVGGSGSGSSGGATKFLEDSLEEAGFKMNPKLYSLYSGLTSNQQSSEVGPGILSTATGSYKLYNDAALVVISRTGSEFNDNSVSTTGHSQQLTDEEKALIEHVKESFDNVVLIINGPNAMELGDYEDDDGITGIIWIGLTGPTGIMALGKILNGEVSPSAKTVDLWEANVMNDPTWQNFCENKQVGASTTILDKSGTAIENKSSIENFNSLDYEEGIYLGYRWYETAAEEYKDTGKSALESLTKDGDYFEGYNAQKASNFDADEEGKLYYTDPTTGELTTDSYYNRSTGVVYPFGFGLSYTYFSWEIVGTDKNKALTSRDQEVTIKVKVTNEGDVAGKDVVELYSTPKYYEGGIEKASVNLVNFQKTKLLQPHKSQILTFTFTPWELASFDDVDANGNGFAGYELEAGTVTMSLRSDSHTVKDNCTVDYTVAEDTTAPNSKPGKTGLEFDTDPTTNNKITAWFSQDDNFNTRRTASVMEDPNDALSFTSRADLVGTFPKAPTAGDRTFNQDTIDYLLGEEYDFSYEDKESDPWYKSEEDIPDTWTQASDADAAKRTNGKTATQLIEMAGVDYNDAKWDEFLNQLTYTELVTLASNGQFQTAALESIGKEQATDSDGPAQLSNGTSWVCEVNIASTWNVDLAEQQGIMVGNESLYQGVQGWYGPGADIHRNANSGRNFEYYSQDGVQGGKIAAAVVRGARSKGVHVYIKHFAMNDQETNRYNVCTWATEQSMREIYLKTFELAVKEGGADGTMSAFNRIGLNSAANYRLYQDVLRGEWGFTGASVTDMYGTDGTTYYPAATGNALVRCFIYPLGSYKANGRKPDGEWDPDSQCVVVPTEDGSGTEKSYTQWYAVRETAKTVLYNAVNTNLMKNGVDTSALKGDTTLTTEVSKEYTSDVIAVDSKALNGGTASYEVTSGALPDGITLDASTGALSGAATELGEYNFTVTLTVDGWVTQSADYKITVTPNVSLDTGKAVTKLDANDYATYQAGSIYTEGRYQYTVNSVSAVFASDTNIPGLTLNADGTLSGTPTTPGTYIVTIEYTLQATYKGTTGGGMGGPGGGGEGGPGGDMGQPGDMGGGDFGGGDMGQPGDMGGGGAAVQADDDDSETFTTTGTIMIVVSGEGTVDISSADSAEAASGCGSVIGAGSAALAALAVLGSAVVVMRKKED